MGKMVHLEMEYLADCSHKPENKSIKVIENRRLGREKFNLTPFA